MGLKGLHCITEDICRCIPETVSRGGWFDFTGSSPSEWRLCTVPDPLNVPQAAPFPHSILLQAACTAAQLQVISPEGEVLHCIGLGPAFRATCIAAYAGEGLVVGSSATGPAFLALDDTGAPTRLERQEQGAVAAMCCLRTGAAALFGSGKVEVWHVAGGTVERRARLCPPRHAGAVREVCTCLRRPIVVSAAADQCIRLWDAADCGLVLVRAMSAAGIWRLGVGLRPWEWGGRQ